jgi:hypothetical protein
MVSGMSICSSGYGRYAQYAHRGSGVEHFLCRSDTALSQRRTRNRASRSSDGAANSLGVLGGVRFDVLGAANATDFVFLLWNTILDSHLWPTADSLGDAGAGLYFIFK